MKLVLHDSSSTKTLKEKGKQRVLRGGEKRKRSALHLVLSTVNIIFTYKVPTKGFLSV